jgi:hypothetical protein
MCPSLSAHPSLPFDIPAPMFLLTCLALSFILRSQHLSTAHLRNSFAAFHILVYISTLHSTLRYRHIDNVNIPLLSYTALVLDGTVGQRGFWRNTSVAVGWILAMPNAPVNDNKVSYMQRLWIACALSVMCSANAAKLRPAAAISALCLLTCTLVLVVEARGVVVRGAVGGVPLILSALCTRVHFSHAFPTRVQRVCTIVVQSSMIRESVTVGQRIVG